MQSSSSLGLARLACCYYKYTKGACAREAGWSEWWGAFVRGFLFMVYASGSRTEFLTLSVRLPYGIFLLRVSSDDIILILDF